MNGRKFSLKNFWYLLVFTGMSAATVLSFGMAASGNFVPTYRTLMWIFLIIPGIHAGFVLARTVFEFVFPKSED